MIRFCHLGQNSEHSSQFILAFEGFISIKRPNDAHELASFKVSAVFPRSLKLILSPLPLHYELMPTSTFHITITPLSLTLPSQFLSNSHRKRLRHCLLFTPNPTCLPTSLSEEESLNCLAIKNIYSDKHSSLSQDIASIAINTTTLSY